MLVDGYNILFAWEELAQLAARNIDSARGKLMDILCNYQGYLGIHLILVFDAYRCRIMPRSPFSITILLWFIPKRQKRQISISKSFLMKMEKI